MDSEKPESNVLLQSSESLQTSNQNTNAVFTTFRDSKNSESENEQFSSDQEKMNEDLDTEDLLQSLASLNQDTRPARAHESWSHFRRYHGFDSESGNSSPRKKVRKKFEASSVLEENLSRKKQHKTTLELQTGESGQHTNKPEEISSSCSNHSSSSSYDTDTDEDISTTSSSEEESPAESPDHESDDTVSKMQKQNEAVPGISSHSSSGNMQEKNLIGVGNVNQIPQACTSSGDTDSVDSEPDSVSDLGSSVTSSDNEDKQMAHNNKNLGTSEPSEDLARKPHIISSPNIVNDETNEGGQEDVIAPIEDAILLLELQAASSDGSGPDVDAIENESSSDHETPRQPSAENTHPIEEGGQGNETSSDSTTTSVPITVENFENTTDPNAVPHQDVDEIENLREEGVTEVHREEEEWLELNIAGEVSGEQSGNNPGRSGRVPPEPQEIDQQLAARRRQLVRPLPMRPVPNLVIKDTDYETLILQQPPMNVCDENTDDSGGFSLIYRAAPEIIQETNQLYLHFLRAQFVEAGINLAQIIIEDDVRQSSLEQLNAAIERFRNSSLRERIRVQANSVDLSTLNFFTFNELLFALFRGGDITWERVVVLFSFCGYLSMRYIRCAMRTRFLRLYHWTTIYLSYHMSSWIENQGGWLCITHDFPIDFRILAATASTVFLAAFSLVILALRFRRR